jgi:hypothetical protein
MIKGRLSSAWQHVWTLSIEASCKVLLSRCCVTHPRMMLLFSAFVVSCTVCFQFLISFRFALNIVSENWRPVVFFRTGCCVVGAHVA